MLNDDDEGEPYRSLEPYILLAAIVALLLLVALGFAAARMLGAGR